MTTKTAQFTPGPWFYNYDDYCIVNQAGVSVVNVHGAMGGNDTNADIALIAAAPAMYEALSQVQAFIKTLVEADVLAYPTKLTGTVEAALAQAEGQ